mmetsp:Transcript_52714/g.123742  ORF Transcript_52714/g.123742 Transcript_52714/m.123742 type:complete len:88 (+) Transcript_52714:2-265(+)
MQLEWKQHTPIVTCTKFQASLAKTSHALERWRSRKKGPETKQGAEADPFNGGSDTTLPEGKGAVLGSDRFFGRSRMSRSPPGTSSTA